MTDLEKLTALLGEWGVPYAAGDGEVQVGQPIGGGGIGVGADHPGDEAKVGGYTGFYTLFTFDAEGRFVKMGAWE